MKGLLNHIQQEMRHRQTHHIGGENKITRFSHENVLLWLYAFFATLKIGNILLNGNSVTPPHQKNQFSAYPPPPPSNVMVSHLNRPQSDCDLLKIAWIVPLGWTHNP